MVNQDEDDLYVGTVNFNAGKNHALTTLTNAVSSDVSCNFSDVTLVFTDGVLKYYR